MTTQEKLIKRKLSILELAEYLKNVSQACKINGVSGSVTISKHLRNGWLHWKKDQRKKGLLIPKHSFRRWRMPKDQERAIRMKSRRNIPGI